jgi:hypothetical protein
MPELTPAQVAAELLRRREIRSNVVKWAQFYGADKGWAPAKHHMFMLEKLQQVTDKKLRHSKTGELCRNLIILMRSRVIRALFFQLGFSNVRLIFEFSLVHIRLI